MSPDLLLATDVLLSSVFAYPLIAGLLLVVGWFVVDETWYLNEHE